MSSHYNPLLVIASFAISILASGVALDLSGRIYLHRSRGRKAFWLLVGSGAMGTGIWSMHYTGMLAYRMGMPVLYDWPTVLLSWVAAIAASAIALGFVTRKDLSWRDTALGALFMGMAIASMHYIGMVAMRMPMEMSYNPGLVALSILAAIAISGVGLRLTWQAREGSLGWSASKVVSALVMGLAIPTMHYIGMSAARFTEGPGRFTSQDLLFAVPVSGLCTLGIVLVSLLVLGLALLFAGIDRHLASFESALDGSKRSYAQLIKHHQLLQAAFRAGGFGVWECDPATGLFYVDESLRDLYGTAHDGLPVPREAWKAAVHPEDVADLDARWRSSLVAGDTYENEYRIVGSGGAIRRVRSVASLVRGADGTLQRVLGMTWEVTADRQREQESSEQALRFRLTLEAIGDAVIATDDELRVVFMNPAAAKLTGWSAEAAVGCSLQEVFVTDAQHTQPPVDPIEHCLAQGFSSFADDEVLLSRSGHRYDIRRHTALMNQGRSAVITFQDVTEARRLENELIHAATHDALTGMPNRVAFERHLNRLWEGNRYSNHAHCLCIVDLDRFKIINDASGHIAGDALLREMGTLMRANLRPADIAARMGGDEFMLLLPNTTAAQAEPILHGLLQAIRTTPFHWQGKIYGMTVSLGLVPFDCFSPEPEVLLSQADAAVFAAKRNGRDQIAVYGEQGQAASQLLEAQVASDLRRCIEEDAFELHAQPIVAADQSDDSRYFEVLLRMRDREGKLVSPALFIPAAERFGMMGMVDRWVVRNALDLLSNAGSATSAFRLAINLSADSLSDLSLWEFVSAEFDRTGLDPARITFEVTETGIIQQMETARTFMKRCREAGCRIALDDFGTGLSSLSYLKHFPLDTIKIDGGFIRTLLQSSLDQAIIRSISGIARSIGATTVAECVEDQETLSMLRGLQVDWIQGWATGKPVPLTEVLAGAEMPVAPSLTASSVVPSSAQNLRPSAALYQPMPLADPLQQPTLMDLSSRTVEPPGVPLG